MKKETISPNLDADFWRVQVLDDEECVILDPSGSSYVITYRDLERYCKQKGFINPADVSSYLWNFKAIRVDFKNHNFGSVPYLDQLS